jgi:phage terminase large subunit-like protein
VARPKHGALQKAGVKPPLRLAENPPWHGWNHTSLPRRVKQWVEQYVKVTTGYRSGGNMRVAGFQDLILRTIYNNRASFIQIPAGNGKTTFMAALALERCARGDDYVEVDVVATKQEQAGQIIDCAVRMVESSPDLLDLFAFYSSQGVLEYRPTGSRMKAHPSKLSAVQGLNFSLAIIDEFGFAADEVVESLLARLGKRPDATVVGIGTPGFEENVMYRLRERHLAGTLPPGVTWLEWSADEGCAINDRRQWLQSNPAIKAGFLNEDAIAVQAALIDEASFRVYHLGQWIGTVSGWLPVGAWDSCPMAVAPPDGTDVVLAVEGTYRRTTAVVGATLEGAVFYGWAAEVASDAELRAVLDNAGERYNVKEIVVAPRIRPHLFQQLAQDGAEIYRWTNKDETAAAEELFRAVLEGRIAHDHHPLLEAQINALVARRIGDGSIRLQRPSDINVWVDAAMALRLAWWRAAVIATQPIIEAPSVY